MDRIIALMPTSSSNKLPFTTLLRPCNHNWVTRYHVMKLLLNDHVVKHLWVTCYLDRIAALVQTSSSNMLLQTTQPYRESKSCYFKMILGTLAMRSTEVTLQTSRASSTDVKSTRDFGTEARHMNETVWVYTTGHDG
jgi:hypothetical protein